MPNRKDGSIQKQTHGKIAIQLHAKIPYLPTGSKRGRSSGSGISEMNNTLPETDVVEALCLTCRFY